MLKLATSKNLTVLGIATIAGALAAAVSAAFDGDAATNINWELLIAALVLGVTQIMSKGASSTGGTVPETDEAASRLAAAA